jgi:thiamine pyrophosphate-dependent acetolactate synthase large subunit-like protein
VSLCGPVLRSLRGGDGSRYLSMSGASLGWGTGAACGVALASGERVTCILGDGALRFGAQALWTAKACELPITYVVLDNGGFGSTRSFERHYVATLGQPDARAGYVGSDLSGTSPSVRELITGYGIGCEAVTASGDIRSALTRLWDAKGPNALVIDVGFDAGAWARQTKDRGTSDARR